MKRRTSGLEWRLFILVFTVATLISVAFTFYTYAQEKRIVEEQLGEQLLRVAHVFAASLDAAEVEQVAFAPPDSELALKYRALAQRIADEAGLAYAYTCTQTEPGTCV